MMSPILARVADELGAFFGAGYVTRGTTPEDGRGVVAVLDGNGRRITGRAGPDHRVTQTRTAVPEQLTISIEPLAPITS